MKRIFREFPHAAAILTIILLMATFSTWFLPSVTFSTITDPDTNFISIDKNSVEIVNPESIGLFELPKIIIESVTSALPLIILLCVANGFFMILISSSMFDAVIGNLCNKFLGKEPFLIAILIIGFSILGLVIPPHCFIAFVPTVILLSKNMGYDALVGLSIVFLGSTISALAAPISATTALYQEVVGLPIFSGWGGRLVIYIILLIITIIYILKYAKKIKENPDKSFFGKNKDINSGITQKNMLPVKPIYIVIFILLQIMFGHIIYGSTVLKYNINDISAVFILYSIVCGLLLRYNLSQLIKHFIRGISQMTSICVILVLANAVTVILKSAGVLNTLIYYSSKVLVFMPGFMVPIAMLFFVSIMNAVLPSGPAKGVMFMPLLGPIGQLSGVTMQTTIVSYNFGDGFSNYLLPYDSMNAIYLETAKMQYIIWVKFIFRLFVMWNIIGSIILVLLYFIGYGPF